MSENVKKTVPAYLSPSAFDSLINGLRETHIPPQFDRSVMPKASGSQYSATVVTLRFLRMLDQNNKPTARMKQYVEASDEDRPAILKSMLEESYAFIINPDFDLEKATGNMVAEKFRAEGVSGTTLSKAVSFFLVMAKKTGIKVSSLVKAPSAPAPGKGEGRKAARPRREDAAEADYEDGTDEEIDEELERFELPIPGKRNAVVTVPKDLEPDDWDMLTKMLDLYIKQLQKRAGGAS